LCPENVFTALKLKNADKQSIKRRASKKRKNAQLQKQRCWVFFRRGASQVGKEEKVPVFAGCSTRLCSTLSKARSLAPCIAAGPPPPSSGLRGAKTQEWDEPQNAVRG